MPEKPNDVRHITTEKYIEMRDYSTYNENNNNQSQNLSEAAEEIKKLLEQLNEIYSIDPTENNKIIATKVIQKINKSPGLTQKMLSAIKAGSLSALESLVNHPAASFVISALEDWRQEK